MSRESTGGTTSDGVTDLLATTNSGVSVARLPEAGPSREAWRAHTGSTMATSPGIRRPHLAGSPFAPYVDRVVEQYALNDRVTHDAHGLGRVVGSTPGE